MWCHMHIVAVLCPTVSVSEVVGTAAPSNSGIVLGTVDNARSVLVCTNRHFAVKC